MKPSNSASPWRATLEINDPRAAAYLASPRHAAYLYPFIGRERGAQEVAREYNLGLDALLYQIRRLRTLGLLEVVHEVKRGGRALKRYRASADALFVPFNATTAVTLEAMVQAWSESLQDVYLKGFAAALRAEHDTWGVRISRDPGGLLLIAPATSPDAPYNYFAPDAPSVLEGWFSDLRLSDADAKTFQLELFGLYVRYLGRAGEQRYLLRVALAPIEENALPALW
jgi:hypothetical protein